MSSTRAPSRWIPVLAFIGVAAACATAAPPATESPPSSLPPVATPSHSVAHPAPPTSPTEDACLASARAGTLADGVPAVIDGFKVMTKDPNRVTLVRGGRHLTDAEGDTLWKRFQADHFGSADGLTTGSHAMGPIAACPHVPNASCFFLSIYACQLAPERLVRRMKDAADASALGDAEVEIVLEFREPRGPTCKDGPACVPGAHYSRKDDVYDPKRGRAASPGESGGACKDDGDCQAGQGSLCVAWQLSGAPQNLLYVQREAPTFCGCIAGQCSWFTQP